MPAPPINILDAKTRLSELLNAVQAGGEVVIAKRGRPVARLVPVAPPADDEGARSEGIVTWLRSHPLPTHARRSAEAIAQALAEESAAWD
ncbi:MAG: type II toxin-antitoxin system prevent-host-death family antitoxin [Pseudomonas sp.]